MSEFPLRRSRLPLAALLTTAVGMSVLSGCSFSDEGDARPVPKPSAEAADLCRKLQETLPKSVDGLDRSADGPDSDFAADWGDPAVQLRCGVPRPELLTHGSEHYNPTAEGMEVNGVLWLTEKQDDGYRFTTTGRLAYVEVTVPGKYAPETSPLLDLAKAVKKSVPSEL
ncbi:DUF3515 domain-containing protein [Streptomyces sp. NPDC047108]|uniref:DUF3515 domain-containing protein n=1 Tax=Streptomyces sp. NPDC047108 TaxID=3155025 RepID=UPI003408B672